MSAAPSNGNGRANIASLVGTAATVVAVVLAIVGYLGRLSIDPLSDGVKDNKSRIEQIIRDSDNLYVRKDESLAYRKRIDDILLKIGGEIDKIVPRGEHIEKWASNTAALSAQQRQIDEIRRDLGSSYSLGDKIKELQRQIEMLRDDNKKSP